MEQLNLKNAVFYPNAIIFPKKGNLRINISDIAQIVYRKPSLQNYFFASTTGAFPGRLEIFLNRKLYGTDLYFVKIKYKEVLKLLGFFQKEIDTGFI